MELCSPDRWKLSGRGKKEIEPVLVLKDRVTEPKPQLAAVKKRPVWAVAAIIAPVFLMLGFLIATSVAPPNSALASLNPFALKEEKQYRQQTFHLPEQKKEDNNDNVIVLNENGIGTLTLNEDMKNIVFVYVRDTVAVDHTKVKRSGISPLARQKRNISGNFQVVVGCFRDKNNASRLVQSLNSQNINAGISGTNAAGLYVVSVGGFDTKDSASVLLEGIRRNFPAAWIMRK